MGWLVVFVVLICLFFVGFSIKSFFLYLALAGISFGFAYLFLSNKWGLDGLFEEFFRAVELFGFGAPHRLDSRIAYSSFYTDGGFNSLEEIPKPIEEGLKRLIANIIRDFIRTWYENVGEGEHFIAETRESLEMLSLEGYKRASQIDSHYLMEQVIVVFHGHLERFNKALAIVKAKDPKLRLSISSSQLLCQTYESQLRFEPPALSSPGVELSYLRNVIDSLLAAMIPKDTFSCDAGRFILREILTVQVMLPLVELLTDPDCICQALIDILQEYDDSQVQRTELRHVGDEHDATDHSDSLSSADQCQVNDKVQTLSLVENTTARPANKNSDTELRTRQESKDSIGDVGERIEITSPGACVDTPDFQWSVTSQRQPPIGESQHDSRESFLVISLEESRANSDADQSQNESKWSTEVAPRSSDDNLTSFSLSSSWGICPSSQDDSFRAQSFEEMKEHLSEIESNGDTGGKLRSLKEMTCFCGSGESDEGNLTLSMVAQKGSSDEGSDAAEEAACLRVRTRSFSLPGSNEMPVSNAHHSELSRSASVPCKLSLADSSNQRKEHFHTPKSPRKIHGSQFYSTSFCSSSDSFKSMSSEEDILDSYIEQGEEALEHDSDFNPYFIGTHGIDNVNLARSRLTKQASFDERQEKLVSDSSAEESLGPRDNCSPSGKEKFGTDITTAQRTKDYTELSSARESSWENVDKEKGSEDSTSQQKGNLLSGFGAQGSESSFGDAFLTAGKKFVSNFKPPFKFDSLSSNSTKSSETSGGESLDNSGENQLRSSPQEVPVDTGRARAATYTSCSVRHLSRSPAVVEESTDSDADTCYGTPRDESVQDVMGVNDMGEAGDSSSMMSVKRMHPSQLISIPTTVVALETTWEPGRNKYTLYKIEVCETSCCSFLLHNVIALVR